MKTSTPTLCIAGPTASGKSALALAYALHEQAHGRAVELICVDSATIYKGMDIGTAKPSQAELALVSHHLIDIRDPSIAYNAGEFARDAARLIAEIKSRGAQPVLVGGTMLYFKALLEGMDDLPVADLAIRAQLDAQAKAQGWPALHAELGLIDTETAARLSPNDSQRIQRALEVYRSSGITLSAHFLQQKNKADADSHSIHELFQLVALEPQDRRWLHERIAHRYHEMCRLGLVDEVQRLKSRPDLQADLPSMRCVGYRQVWEFLNGDGSEAQMQERGIAATRQLAKRQLTWLRGWQGKISLPCETVDVKMLLQALKGNLYA